MLSKTEYSVDINIIQSALDSQISNAFKLSLNQPTGDFFYDPWVIKEEFKGTAWEKLLQSLPKDIGEARLITLVPGQCYQSHADIDNRYHLNLAGLHGYLIDLENNKTIKLVKDGIWYEFSTDRLHSAANFGTRDRHQLVVRKLLTRNELTDRQVISLSSTMDPEDARFFFDNIVSKWLNHANKSGKIDSFSFKDNQVQFAIERNSLEELLSMLNGEFVIKFL